MKRWRRQLPSPAYCVRAVNGTYGEYMFAPAVCGIRQDAGLQVFSLSRVRDKVMLTFRVYAVE
ncbi:MAG: hypothetical protein R6V06_01570 [Kiritimatiellia bacterium]